MRSVLCLVMLAVFCVSGYSQSFEIKSNQPRFQITKVVSEPAASEPVMEPVSDKRGSTCANGSCAVAGDCANGSCNGSSSCANGSCGVSSRGSRRMSSSESASNSSSSCSSCSSGGRQRSGLLSRLFGR